MKVNGRTTLYGILGHPVGHSLSPAMQNAAFDSLGLNAVYVPLEVEPKQLRRVCAALPSMGFRGINLTVPHKEKVLPLLERLTGQAQTIGAVNTVVIRGGTLIGDNTDGDGFLRSLQDADVALQGTHAVLLGAGGGARAVAVSLLGAGCSRLTLANRTKAKAAKLRDALKPVVQESQAVEVVQLNSASYERELASAQVLINATTVGLDGKGEIVAAERLHPKLTVVDLVYCPSSTPLVASARKRRLKAVDGLGMLLHQGALAFERWTGQQAPLDVMRRALQRAAKEVV